MPGFETLTLPLIAAIAVVVLFAGVVQGALGLGFPTVATPLIALATDIRTAIIIVLLPCIATVLVAAVSGVPIRRVLAEFWMMPLYMLVGAAIGTTIFIAYPELPYTVLLAAMILIYLGLGWLGLSEWPFVHRHKRPFGVLFGVAAGLSEGTANVAAPALIVYYLAIAVQPTMLVQAMNICFLAGKTTQFVTLTSAGGVTAAQWLVTLPLAVVAGAGAIYGVRIRARIDARTFTRWLRGALLVIALLLFAQYIYALAS